MSVLLLLSVRQIRCTGTATKWVGMRVFDGRETLEFERTGETVRVLLAGAQIRMDSVDIVRHHVTLAEEVPEQFQAVVTYRVPAAARTLRQAASAARTRLEKLQTAQKLAALRPLAGKFRIPFLHPENIVITGAGVSVTHSGLVGILAPMAFDDALFLKGYKALVLSILHPRLPFEKLIDGTATLKDDFSKRVTSFTTVDDIAAFVDREVAEEASKAARETVSVRKLRYRLTTVLAAVAVVAASVSGWWAYESVVVAQPRQEAIITAQSDFLTSDYAQTLKDLQEYGPNDLPKSARYVLAVSSIKLTKLTAVQKQSVLNNISTKTDDNTLDYWIHLARGDLDTALNLAQNLGDDQLTLLAYTDLYEATKLDTSMEGARKQKLLDEYAKKIEELTARLGASR